MQIFDYCEESSESQMTEEWHQEQQTKYNFARYAKLDQEKHGKFRKLNDQTLKVLLDPNHEVRAYIVNKDMTTSYEPKRSQSKQF